MTVLLYTTPGCAWCEKTKDLLKKKKIKFKELNVLKSKKYAHEMIHKSGQSGVPVVDNNGTLIVGFDERALSRSLKNK